MMTDAKTPTAYEWLDADGLPISPEVYHGDHSKVGNSMMSDFIDSQVGYFNRYVTGKIPPKEPTPAMKLGNAIHTLLLERDLFHARYLCPPPLPKDGKPWNRTLKDHKAEWSDWKAKANETGRTLLEPDDAVTAFKVNEAVLANPLAAGILGADGPTEQAIVWQDQETGLNLKERRDKVLSSCGTIFDVKSSYDNIKPSVFSRTVYNQGYHRNAAWYVAGDRAFTGETHAYVFIAVSKANLEVAFYELDDAALELGAMENRRALDRLHACLDSGQWLAPHERQITKLALPNYAFQQSQWELESE